MWLGPFRLELRMGRVSQGATIDVGLGQHPTRMSHRPYSPSMRSTISWYSDRLLMSAAIASALPPAASIPASTGPASSGVGGWFITTRPPAAARAAAIALPIPLAAPVTSAVFPAQDVSG